MLGPAILVSYWIGRGAAVRRLFAGVLHWRVNVGWYLFAVLAMPLATIPVSLVTGTLPHTAGGWAGMCVTYLISLLVGAVFTNLWEEVAWVGFVQSRLTARRGLIVGAVITGPLFAAQHLPSWWRAVAASPECWLSARPWRSCASSSGTSSARP